VHFQSRSSYEHTPCRKLRSRRNEKFNRCSRLSVLKNGQQRNVLTVAVSCANRTRKHAASVTAYSVLRACPSIRNTRSQPQRITGKTEKEKPHEDRGRSPHLKMLMASRRTVRPHVSMRGQIEEHNRDQMRESPTMRGLFRTSRMPLSHPELLF